MQNSNTPYPYRNKRKKWCLPSFSIDATRATTKECVIDGDRKLFHGKSEESLQAAKDFYEPKGFTYIGSSMDYYIGGTKQECDIINHFFVNNFKI